MQVFRLVMGNKSLECKMHNKQVCSLGSGREEAVVFWYRVPLSSSVHLAVVGGSGL